MISQESTGSMLPGLYLLKNKIWDHFVNSKKGTIFNIPQHRLKKVIKEYYSPGHDELFLDGTMK